MNTHWTSRSVGRWSSRREAARLVTRRGFTLIELLVVIGIVLLLAVMTIAAVNFSFNSEKTRSAARQVQSYLEGCRDRAIHAKEARGVRLFVEQTNPHAVTSMVYIAPSEPWTQGTLQLERYDANGNGFFNDAGENPGFALAVHGFNTDWDILMDEGMLVSGISRIKIPGDQDGLWYTINIATSGSYNLTAANQYLILTTPFRQPPNTQTTQRVAFQGGGPTTYQLELAPRELPGSDPVQLPKGVVIDLDHSSIPSIWGDTVDSTGASTHPTRLDLMFSARGTVIGSPASKGIIHLLLARDIDAELEMPADLPGWSATTACAKNEWVVPTTRNGFMYRANTAGTTGGTEPAWPTIVGNTIGDSSVTWQCVDERDHGDRLVISIFAQTGNISSHPVFESNPAVAKNLYNKNIPFKFAVSGEVAGQ